MAGNSVKLEFAGDADKLLKASKQSQTALDDVGKSATDLGGSFEKSGKSTDDYVGKIGSLGAGISGISDAVDSAGGVFQDFVDLQSASAEQAQKQKRRLQDVAQAQEDYNQALRDSKQAAIDSGQAKIDEAQANLDVTTAQKDYNDAVKKHGKNSDEAKQALIDIKQAQQDVTQAQEDGKQAVRDQQQAAIDAKGAQLDLIDAQKESNPSELQQWADKLNLITPLLSGLVGIVGLVTAAQWLWNTSLLASPITWIVIAIAAVIAIVILLVKHWDWVKKVGAAAWDWIKKAAGNTWDFLKKIPGWLGGAFKSVAKVLTSPFRTAFNAIADLWNNTIGKLSWSVPGWVPGIGGNSISVPHIPRFHTGGTVPGPVGQETLAILTGGERVSSTAGGDSGGWVVIRGDAVIDDLVRAIAARVSARGGRAAQLGIRFS